jgi:predicted HTH transcriptional regulator
MWLESAHEDQQLEFKEAKNQMSEEDVCKYCVAIANEGGGQMILGVTDKIPRRTVGTLAFQNIIKTTQRLQQLLGFRVDVEEFFYDGNRVVIFHITSRPSGTALNYKGQYLMRCGAQLLPMGDEQLRKIHFESKEAWLNERFDLKYSPQDVIELLDTQAFFELLHQTYPTERGSVLEKLEQEQLIFSHGEGYLISRICALLFAKRLSDFAGLERKAPRVIVYRGTDKLGTVLDQLETKGYAVGFQGLIGFIASQLPRNEAIQDSIRREVTLVPDVVIRELVANALIHQCFDISGASVMIEIYSNRVEISNPGEPVVPLRRFIDSYRSRNERLADIMRRIGICEEKGSGIDRVIATVEVYQLPAPEFTSTFDRTVVKLFGYKPFDEMSRDERIRACYQHACLKWVMNEQMTNKSLRERFKISEGKSAIISQVISFTTDAKLIKTDYTAGGSRKFARYLPYWA